MSTQLNSSLPVSAAPRRAARWMGFACLLVLLLTSTGCNKMLANYRLKSAQKRVEESKENEATRFSAPRLDSTQAQINRAQNEFNQGDFKQASASAKEAVNLSKQLLEETKVQRANALKNDANTWLKRADLNQGKLEGQDLYNQILEDNDRGGKYMEKKKWDRAIATYIKVVDGVQFLLSTLENDAKRGLVESEAMREDLITEGAKEHAPEFVEQLSGEIEEIRRFIEQEYDYRSALSTRDLARQTKQAGIQKTKEVKSRKQIREIEDLLAQATTLGANIFASQSWTVISKDFEDLLTQFYESNYDTVLTQAPQLKPRVEDLIIETKREAARAEMDAVKTAIATLHDGKARQLLPGRVEQLDALLEQAQADFEEAKYTESKEVSQRALALNDQIIQEFDALADSHIRGANEVLSAAGGVFQKMEAIFDKQIPGNWTEEQRTLEDSKQALKEELRSQLRNDEISVGLAELKRQAKEFSLAIQIAEEVSQSAEQVIQQTYRVVAHNSILELANALTRYEADGGRQYAPQEVDKTLAMLEESKSLLADGNYRDAVRRTADTKAQLEILVQELERVAVDRIQRAEGAVGQAKDQRADQYQTDALTQAEVALSRARDSLAGEGLRSAIELATQSESIATDAGTNALRQWAEQELAESEGLLDKARAAGAQRWAPAQLQAAVELRRQLQSLYEQGSYAQAVEVGTHAVDAARETLYAKVVEAENAIATAKRFNGWEFEHDSLAQAIVTARTAREQLDAGNYAASEESARAAIQSAEKITASAKNQSFSARMASLETNLENARRLGAGFYQVGDLAKVLAEMNELQKEFDPNSFDDFSKRVELLEAQLAGLVELTPEVLTDLVLAMQDRLAALEQRGARNYLPEKVDQLEMKIKFAQLDFRNGKYRPSFLNARDAQELLSEIEINLQEREFDAAVNGMIEEFNGELRKFGPVLDMGAPTLIRMVIGPDGRPQAVSLLEASSPSDLHTRISEIGSRARALTPPATREGIHASLIEMLLIAKTAAANFEKMLILDQYSSDEARQIIQTAYQQVFRARKRQQEIQHALVYPQTHEAPAGVERVISFQGI